MHSNKKIYLFEPNMEYSGHFPRYINHLKELFEGQGLNVVLLNNKKTNNIQPLLVNTVGFLNKTILFFKLIILYYDVIKKYKRENVLITSQANLALWILAILHLKKYHVNIISCHYYHSKFKFIFRFFLYKAKSISFTNEYHRDLYDKNGLILKDRIHKVDIDITPIDCSMIKVLGHISKKRNPIQFIDKLRNKYTIVVKGKIIDSDILMQLEAYKNIRIYNNYLSDDEYKAEIRGSIVYIPVSKEYSDSMISGVFLDVIENNGIPLLMYHPLYDEFFRNGLALDITNLDLTNFGSYNSSAYNNLCKKYNSQSKLYAKKLCNDIK